MATWQAWAHSGLHGDRMRTLAEEIHFDAEEAGIEAPKLSALANVAELGGELFAIARDLGTRSNTEAPVPGRSWYTKHGKERRRQQYEAAPAM
jgi:hypothetical protein